MHNITQQKEMEMQLGQRQEALQRYLHSCASPVLPFFFLLSILALLILHAWPSCFVIGQFETSYHNTIQQCILVFARQLQLSLADKTLL